MLKCGQCNNAFVDSSKSDFEMKRQGYKTCRKSRNEIERATFIRGETECLWPDRLSANPSDNYSEEEQTKVKRKMLVEQAKAALRPKSDES